MKNSTTKNQKKNQNHGAAPIRQDCRSDEVENKYRNYFFYLVGFFTASGDKWVSMPDFLISPTLLKTHLAEIK